jgi:hypothetical protein
VQHDIGKTIAGQTLVHGALVIAFRIIQVYLLRVLGKDLAIRPNRRGQHLGRVTGISADIHDGHAALHPKEPKGLVGFAVLVPGQVEAVPVGGAHLLRNALRHFRLLIRLNRSNPCRRETQSEDVDPVFHNVRHPIFCFIADTATQQPKHLCQRIVGDESPAKA